jgi:predicted metal-dependent hydrolase
MHPITVRTMKFDVPSADEFHPLYIAGNAPLSYSHTALGLYVAYLEPFLVKSMRKVFDQIGDDALREDVDRFCLQEAQHYQRHVDFNKVVIAHGYPGLEQRIGTLRRDFERFHAEASDQFCIGYAEGFESYTRQSALQMFELGVYDHHRTTHPFGDLFKWHMLEEIEHRNVAFDLYEYLYGDYFFRARMCWTAQSHMLRFFHDCRTIMSRADVPRHGERCRITAKGQLLLATSPLALRARSMLPGYTPHKYRLPPAIAEISAQFTQMAVSIR